MILTEKLVKSIRELGIVGITELMIHLQVTYFEESSLMKRNSVILNDLILSTEDFDSHIIRTLKVSEEGDIAKFMEGFVKHHKVFSKHEIVECMMRINDTTIVKGFVGSNDTFETVEIDLTKFN